MNPDGWIVTAYHIVEQLQKMAEERQVFRALEAEKLRLQGDMSLELKARRKAIASLKWPPDDEKTLDCAAWWGRNGLRLVDIMTLPAVDVAVGRLEPFEADWIDQYPIFKDPNKDFEPGVSLCKLGFAFHSLTPSWDAGNGTFKFPPQDFPLPLFPIEGILTRIANVLVSGQAQAPPFPLQLVETSSPGLRGQSGGPTFDSRGTIWAIQSRTIHYPLGFDGLGRGQFLNAGLGVHTATLLPFFEASGIKYEKSEY